MRQRNSLRLIVGLVALLLPACASVQVRSDYDVEADFSSLGTFALVERPGREARQRRPIPLVEGRLARSTRSELEGKGFRSVPVGSADFLVEIHTAVREKVVVSHSYAYPRRWRRGWGWGATRVHRYREGSVVIDVIDRRSRRVIWRGLAEGAFTKPDPSAEDVGRVVSKLLAEFPPP